MLNTMTMVVTLRHAKPFRPRLASRQNCPFSLIFQIFYLRETLITILVHTKKNLATNIQILFNERPAKQKWMFDTVSTDDGSQWVIDKTLLFTVINLSKCSSFAIRDFSWRISKQSKLFLLCDVSDIVYFKGLQPKTPSPLGTFQ